MARYAAELISRAHAMSIAYYKRFRMEIDLRTVIVPEPILPESYFWTPWSSELVERHAQTKWESFRYELDSQVFPCLGDYVGCFRLMLEIFHRDNFLPEATWLISHGDREHVEDVATIQGLTGSQGLGAIQNVGVVPLHRGKGLGRALVLKNLQGFQAAGMNRVSLEVTAENDVAIQLYQSLGFRTLRTIYKAVEEPLGAY